MVIARKRIGIRLDDDVVQGLRALSARSGRSMSALVADAVQDLLATSGDGGAEGAPQLITYGSGGMAPDIDPFSNESIRDAMDKP